MTISSKDNEKLKLVRKLAERKHREREGLFVTEGEDLLEAGRLTGVEPSFVLVREGAGLSGEEVDARLLDSVSSLGSGTRVIAVWPIPKERQQQEGLCVYLHGVGDPGNVGSIIRSAEAFSDSWFALGPGCADPYGPKAVRASMGAIFFARTSRCEVGDTPSPRLAMTAHGASKDPLPGAATLCLGAEREGLPDHVLTQCDATWTIPVREDAVESLGVAAAAAIALSRIGSPTEERG
jgi:TrmH family RNA methyltransferase